METKIAKMFGVLVVGGTLISANAQESDTEAPPEPEVKCDEITDANERLKCWQDATGLNCKSPWPGCGCWLG